MNEVSVSMNNISKSFPGVKALDPDENPQRCIYQR